MTKSEALDAFLSPKSRILARNADKTSTSNGLLGPHDWAQKIATVLHPGPPFYSRLDNSDLIQTLGDASLMNCAANAASAEAALQKRKVQKASAAANTSTDNDSWLGVGTIWSALDSLPVGTQWGELSSIGKEANDVQTNGEATDDAHDDGLWSSVSFCADLQGGDVALNKSVVIPSEVLSANNFFRGNREALLNIGIGAPQDEKADYRWDDFARDATNSSAPGAYSISYLTYAFSLPASPIVGLWEWPSWVPFLGNKDKSAEEPKPDQPKKDDKPKGSKRVWIPSTTKTSFQAHWWGFTLWLPEPVMTELGKDADQAENIAKTVSKILSAILTQASKIPMPAALTTILTVLRSVAPVTNYVSSFIGWSWDELKSYDKGQGVALSATWILPVAMIPRTWDAPSAPPDTNGDGKPDGPPEPASPEQPKAPEQGQEPKKPEGTPSDTAPPSAQPQEPSDGSQQPAEPQKPVGDKETGAKQPGANQPDAKQPQTTQPDAKQPDAKQPDMKQPQTKQPDARQPDAKQPDTKQPTAKQPEAKQPKTQQPGTKQPGAKQPDASPSPPAAGKPVASPPQDHAVQPKKPAGQDNSNQGPKATPPDGTLPAPGASAPVERGSQPPPTGAPPATLEPSKRGEYPKNNPATEKPAPGATLPPVKPTKEQLGMSTPDPDNENDGAKYGPAAPLGRGKAKQ